MFPFRRRWRWWATNRYTHLAIGLERHARSDTLLQARLASLKSWNRARAAVSVLLSLGAVTAAVSILVQYIPDVRLALGVLDVVAQVTGGLAGLLAVVYLLLTRVLGMLEADVVVLIAAEKAPKTR